MRATPTSAEAEVSDSPSFLSEPTSDFIVEAIDQAELLSLAVATFMPVEISFWTLPRLELTDLRVWRATRALELVRIEDIGVFLRGARDLRPRLFMDWPANAA